MSLPLSVLTGFLGSGKTTLLNRLLKDPSLEGTLVIVNELGEIGLDHHLMTELDDSFVLLQSGCVCCSLREDLVEALGHILTQKDTGKHIDIQRVVLETTGIFDPTPLQSLFGLHSPLYGQFHLDGVIVTVDSILGRRQIETRRDVREQIVFADRLILTKTDVATQEEKVALRIDLETLNPRADVVDMDDSRPAITLLSAGLISADSGDLAPTRWLSPGKPALGQGVFATAPQQHVHAHSDVVSLSVHVEAVMNYRRFASWASLLCEFNKERVLRIKALLSLDDRLGLFAFDVVYGVVHPMTHLPPIKELAESSSVVVIGSGFSQAELKQIEAGIRACTTSAQIVRTAVEP